VICVSQVNGQPYKRKWYSICAPTRMMNRLRRNDMEMQFRWGDPFQIGGFRKQGEDPLPLAWQDHGNPQLCSAGILSPILTPLSGAGPTRCAMVIQSS